MPPYSLNPAATEFGSAINADVVINCGPGTDDKAHIISGIAFSYDSPPTGGRVTIADGDNPALIRFDLDITTDGPMVIMFEPKFRGSTGRIVVVTLYDGGPNVKGKLNVLGHHTQG
jgi:hypothetical protein